MDLISIVPTYVIFGFDLACTYVLTVQYRRTYIGTNMGYCRSWLHPRTKKKYNLCRVRSERSFFGSCLQFDGAILPQPSYVCAIELRSMYVDMYN